MTPRSLSLRSAAERIQLTMSTPSACKSAPDHHECGNRQSGVPHQLGGVQPPVVPTHPAQPLLESGMVNLLSSPARDQTGKRRRHEQHEDRGQDGDRGHQHRRPVVWSRIA